MKKFLKFCFITAIILILLGLIIATASTAAGGGKELVRMARNGDLTINGEDFDFLSDYDDRLEIGGVEVLYDLDDVEIFKNGKEVLSGDIPLMEVPAENIKDLDINLGGGEFYIKNSSDGKFYIKGENVEKLQVYAEDSEMYLKALRNRINDKDTKVYFYIPEMEYRNIDLSLGAGMLIFEDSIVTGDFDGEVGAGQMIIGDIICQDLDINVGAGEFIGEKVDISGETELKVGAGHIELNGSVGKSLDIKCAMGGVELNLNHSETDFNYEIECVAGTVEVGNEEFAAFSTERTVDNHASREMDIECSIGAVVIDFNN